MDVFDKSDVFPSDQPGVFQVGFETKRIDSVGGFGVEVGDADITEEVESVSGMKRPNARAFKVLFNEVKKVQ